MSLKLKAKPYLLKNKIQNYEWGAKGKNAYIPQLLQLDYKEDQSYAELWIGAHPKAPSKIQLNDEEYSFDTLISNGSIKGVDPLEKLPYLLKVLSAGEALSIQAHPNKEQAVWLNKLDPDNYSDDNHKPEIAIAIDSLTALAGFRPAQEIKDVFKEYSIFKELLNGEVDFFINSFGEENEILAFKGFYEKLLKLSVSEPIIFLEKLNQLEKFIVSKESHDEKEVLFLQLKKKYTKADVGLLSIFLLNHLTLSKGEAIFLYSGVPHAYLSGNIIECMANSDNVVRAGLTPKFVDVDNLVKILDYNLTLPKTIRINDNSQISDYKVPISDFEISVLKLNKDEDFNIEIDNKPIVILLISGVLILKKNSEQWSHTQGDALLLPVELENITINALGDNSLAFIVRIPN